MDDTFDVFRSSKPPMTNQKKKTYNKKWPLSKRKVVCPTCGKKVSAFQCKAVNDCMSCRFSRITEKKRFRKVKLQCTNPSNTDNLAPEIINPNNECMLYEG